MSVTGVASFRAAFADLPAPRFISLRNRQLWGAAVRRADEVLGKRPAEATAPDLDVLAEAHSFTQKDRFLVGAIRRTLDRDGDGRDAAAAYRIGYLTRAAGCDEAIPDDDVVRLLALARGSAAHLGGSLDDACARLALVSHLGSDAAAGSRRRAEKRLLAILEAELDPEGVHLSGSPGRHAAVLGHLAAVLDGGFTEAPAFERLRLRMEEVMSWMVAPDGTLTPIGETPAMVIGGAWSGTAVPGRMKAVYRHPALLHSATAGALGVAPARGWRVLPHAGLAILKHGLPDATDRRNEASFLVFNGSRDGSQADHLSLVWFHRGRWLLVDAGYPGGEDATATRPDQEMATRRPHVRRVPNRDAMAAFTRSSPAHNTVAVGGELIDDGRGEFLQWGEVHSIPCADARVSLGPAAHRRSVALGHDWLLVVDRIEGERDREATIWFHSPRDLDVSLRGDQYMMAGGGTPVAWVTGLGDGGEGTGPIKGSLRDPIQGWRVGPTGRPTPAWAYGWVHRLPMTVATLFTTAGPAEAITAGPHEYAWEAAGSRVTVGVDDIGITSVGEGSVC